MTGVSVRILDAHALDTNIDALEQLLIDTVADGAAISFLHPLPSDQARTFWESEVSNATTRGERALFAAFLDERLVGTVQLITAMPTNQPHRAEIAKMMVRPSSRRQGIGRALLLAALDHARALDKKLVTLDTRTGDVSQVLYASVGFQEAGVIPDFALDPDGQKLHPTTYMFKQL